MWQNTKKSGTIFRHLPEDIIQEILSRLPVISLLRFRCVSKSWCSLISSKEFVKTHLENSAKSSRVSHHATVAFFPQGHHTYGIRHHALSALLDEPSYNAKVDFEFSIPKCRDKTRFVGCSNGLCCLFVNCYKDKYFILWNPSTRTYKKTPNVFDRKLHPWLQRCGFGYDGSTDDYKIVAEVMTRDGDEYSSVMKIYSLKMNHWKIWKKHSEKRQESARFQKEGKFVDGKIHWARRVGAGIDTRLEITSFDLGTGAVGVVEQPRCVEGKHYYPQLGVLGGCLSLLCDNAERETEIWIMKQYGVVESWNRVATVAYIGKRLHPSDHPISPLFIAPDGEVLFEFMNSFFIYNPKGKSFRRPAIENSSNFLVAGDVYIQSLVSPYSDGKRNKTEAQMTEASSKV